MLSTNSRREQGISQKSAATAQRCFYTLYDADNKQAREEVEGDDTLPLDLGAQVDSEVPAKGGEAEDGEAEAGEDEKNVVVVPGFLG